VPLLRRILKSQGPDCYGPSVCFGDTFGVPVEVELTGSWTDCLLATRPFCVTAELMWRGWGSELPWVMRFGIGMERLQIGC